MQSTWLAFNTRLGISQEDDQRLFNLYREGKINYKDWTTELVRLYKQNNVVTKDDIEKVSSTIEIRVGAKEAIDAAKAKDYRVIIISGAVDVMVHPLAVQLGVEEWFAASKAIFNEKHELINVQDSDHESNAKLLLLKDFCTQHQYDISEVIAVADGGNDVEIFKVAKGILFGQNKELAPLAWKQIDNLSELSEII